MNSELFFEGKKYISSKRASKISRYNQDYIGQLIRDSKLDAKRVGRSWFVSQESLEKHLGKIKGVEDFKLEKQKTSQTNSAQESKPLYLEGKKFISSKEASDISGYSRDYIGQLVRKSALEAKMVGRLWYVSKPSLEKHIQKQAVKDEVVTVKEQEVSRVQEVKSQISKYQKEDSVFIPNLPKKEILKPAFEDKNFVYVLDQISKPEPKIIYPAISPVKIKSPFVYFKKIIAVSAVVIAIVFGASVISFEFSSKEVAKNNPEVLVSASVLSGSAVQNFAKNWYTYVNNKFIGAGKFFASLFGAQQLAYVPEQTKPVTQGMVVMPSTPENQQTIEHIKSSFSDKVGVSQNADGVTGVITPVFKKVSGDEYLYVLVPVKGNKQ
ncbi:MAG: helix-turn-helix domain-containing protein [Minisyncoccia bacterium]